jgi:hypothetical protein
VYTEANFYSGFDLRPFLYPPLWNGRAFKKIDELVERIEREHL